MSLHDLIYSQQSETQSVEETSPSPRQNKQPKNAPTAFAVAPRAAEQNEAAALDSFYGIQSQYSNTSIPTDAPDVIISNGIERRRKRKRGRPRSKRRIEQEGEEEERWETVSEAERRIERASRKRGYKKIKARWKEREFSLQNEVDYGNSVQHMARIVMKRKQARQQQASSTSAAAQDSDDDRKPAALPDDDDMNSSDEEQQQALGSLWTSMTPQDDTEDSEADDELQPDPAKDYRNWDYLQLGYDVPQPADLQDFYYTNHSRDAKGTFRLNMAARAKRMNDMEAVTFTPVSTAGIRNLPNERHYLETDLPTMCHVHSTFHHLTSLRAMTGRALIASAGKNAALENRMLRDLYSASSRKVARDYHALTQAIENGAAHVLFNSHKWKQRAVAARALGLTREFHHAGPAHRIGYSLERNEEGQKFRNKVLRLLGDGKLSGELNNDKEESDKIEGTLETTDSGVETETAQADGSPASSQEQIEVLLDTRKDVDELDGSPATERAKLESDEEESRTDPKSETVKSTSTDPDATSFRAVLSSDVDYIHKPGTSPPVPLCPLDESGVVLGGEDRYSRVYHNAKIDDATFNVTLSALLARLGQARLEKDLYAIGEIQEQIMAYVDEMVDVNVKQLENFHHMRRKRKEQPSALHYKGVMGLCSYVANSGSALDSANQPDAMGKAALDDDSDDSVSSAHSSTANMKAVAQTIHNHCAECPSSSSLTIFPRIHVTTALSLIAKNLPPSAAEILSRPFDERLDRTPFDIMRKTLEHLEEKQLLTDAHTASASEDVVSVGYLEHVVHQATNIFRLAAEIDPTDMVNQAWYVSGLAASLLLCSGNTIDSKAHLCPSSKKGEDYDMMFSSSDASTRPRHEVRQKMSKFADVRKEVAVAVKKMIQMAQHESSSTENLIVSAALEWKQVIALLVGPSATNDAEASSWSNIRRLHSRFTVRWALADQSQEALDIVEDMTAGRNGCRDNVLDMRAADVEKNPSDIGAWRHFVQKLGAAGTKVSNRQRKECKHRDCVECKRLRKGFNIDHVMLSEQKHSVDWWGRDRTSWWDKHVIGLETSSAETASAIEIFRASESIELQLSKETMELLPGDVGTEQHETDSVDVDGTVSWLNDALHADEDMDVEGFQESHENLDFLLPMPFEVMVRSRDRSKEQPSSLVFGANGGEQILELLCFKIAVVCHLYGVANGFVTEGVWHLAQECWNKRGCTDCDEWRCLLWLSSSLGLNIPQILHDLYTQAKVRGKSGAPYPVKEKEAVRLGVEIFGKEFVKISDYFEVFNLSSGARRVKDIYYSMKCHGEL